jgi:hypothetical protein
LVSGGQHCDENVAGKKFINGNLSSRPRGGESHAIVTTVRQTIEKQGF